MDEFVLSGPEDLSGIPHESVGKLFSEIFNTFDRNSIALIDVKSGESLTYKQLCQLSKNLATSLRLLGVTKNETIALVAENSGEFVIVYLAALFLGAPLHLINPRYTEYELDSILRLSEPDVVFCTKESQANVRRAIKDLDFIKTFSCLDSKEMSKQENGNFRVEENFKPEDHTAVICNSSGTTGLPKGVMITHEMLRLQLIHARDPDFYGLSPGKTLPVVLPFFHIYSLSGLNASLYSGATLVALDHFEPVTFLETIQRYKPQRLFLVSTLVNFLLKSPQVDEHDLTSLKQVCSGGSNLPREDSKALMQKLNLEKFQTGYGMTETGIVLHTSEGLSGSAGRILCGFRLKIVDPATGAHLPPLQTGELCIKGAIMRGYVNNLQRTNEIIDSEGFLHSGDLGHYDRDGFFYVTGRIKDIIKYKSFQVSPFELESILLGLEGIREVAVVGKPDPAFGELPTAFVVKESDAKITEAQICEYLAQRVSGEKRLRGGVRFVGGLPRNSTGKVLRFELIKTVQD